MSEIARTTGRGFLVITGAKAWFLVTQAFINLSLPLFFERYTGEGTVAFGDYGVVINLVSILNMVMITGTIQAVSKVISEVPSRSSRLVWRAMAVQLAIGVPVALAYFIVAPQTARALHDPDLSPYIRLSAAIVLMYSFYAIFVGYFNGRKEFVRQASLDIGFATIKTILIIAAVFVGLGVMGALLGFAVTAVLMTGAAAFWVWRREQRASIPSGEAGTDGGQAGSARRILGYMMALMSYTLLLNLIIRADLFCLKSIAAYRFEHLGHPGELASSMASSLSGIYTGMANLARLPYQAVISITFVIFPIISQATFVGDNRATRAYVRQTLRYSFILVSSLAIILGAMRTQLVEALYPDDYAPGVAALMWLALGMVAFAMTFVGTTILNSAGHPARSLLVVGGTLAAAAVLNVLFLMTGEVGTPMLHRAALATLLATTGGMIAALTIIYHLYRATTPILTLGRIALAGLAIVFTASGVRLVPQPAWLGFSGLVVLICAWLPLYLKYRRRTKRLALLAGASGLMILAGLCYVALVLDEHGRALLLITMVGKMAFLGVLFYALMYLLREFDSDDRERLLSVFRARRSPGKEV